MPELGVLNQRVTTLERDFEEFKKEAIKKFERNDDEHREMGRTINIIHSDVREIKLILTQNQESDRQIHKSIEKLEKDVLKKIDDLTVSSEKSNRWGKVLEKFFIAVIAVCGALAGFWTILKTIGIL